MFDFLRLERRRVTSVDPKRARHRGGKDLGALGVERLRVVQQLFHLVDGSDSVGANHQLAEEFAGPAKCNDRLRATRCHAVAVHRDDAVPIRSVVVQPEKHVDTTAFSFQAILKARRLTLCAYDIHCFMVKRARPLVHFQFALYA